MSGMAELELKQALERARLQDREAAHDKAIKDDQRLRGEREKFINRQHCEWEMIQHPNCVPEMLFANGARLMATHHGVNVMIEAPTDPREKLLNRRLFLKMRLKKYEKQYSEQVEYVKSCLAVKRMGSGPGPGGENDWKTELPKFADLIENMYRELAEIQAKLFPQGTTQHHPVPKFASRQPPKWRHSPPCRRSIRDGRDDPFSLSHSQARNSIMITLNSINRVTSPRCCTDPENLCKKCKAKSDAINKTLSDVQVEEANLSENLSMAPPVFNYGPNWNDPSVDHAQVTRNTSEDGVPFIREGFLVNNGYEEGTDQMIPPVIDWKEAAYDGGKKKKASRTTKVKKPRTPAAVFANNDDGDDDDSGDGGDDSAQNFGGEIITANSGHENSDMIPPSDDWSRD